MHDHRWTDDYANPSIVSRWVHGVSVPSRRDVARLAAYFKVPVAEVEALLPAIAEEDAPAPPPWAGEFARRVAEELVRLGRGGEASASAFSVGQAAPSGGAAWRDPVMVAAHSRLIPVEVRSDCLVPRLEPGWLVWINPNASPADACVVAVEIAGERAFREYEQRGGVERLTARRAHPPVVLPAPEVTILGVIELAEHAP